VDNHKGREIAAVAGFVAVVVTLFLFAPTRAVFMFVFGLLSAAMGWLMSGMWWLVGVVVEHGVWLAIVAATIGGAWLLHSKHKHNDNGEHRNGTNESSDI
jgi:hydrogenase-4 membrane subunit HyfE